jgi:plastocyanin
MTQHTVRMLASKQYDPTPLPIRVGDEVIWHNDGGTHNAAGSNGVRPFDTGDVPVGTDSAPVSFPVASGKAGFEYSCTNHHPNMKGTIIVT